MRWPPAGHVADVPFACVFGALATERATGVLRLEQDHRVYGVSFRDGEIVDAESGAPEDTAGRVALEVGMIDASTVGESIRRLAREPGKSQHEILVAMGAVSGEDAERLIRLVLTRRAMRVFALPQASYAFEAREPGGDPGGPMEARWILYRGLRQSYDERRLDRELSELHDKALRLSGEVDALLGPFGFSDDERIVAAYLAKGYWELFDLIEACLTLPRSAVLSVVLSLFAVGSLDAQPASSVPRLRKRAREATIRLSRENMPVAPASSPFAVRTPGTQPPSGSRGAPSGASKSPPTTPPGAKSGTNPPSRPLGTSPPGRAPGTNPPSRASGTSPPARAPGTIPPAGMGATMTPGDGVIQQIREQIAAKLAQIEAHVDHFAVLEVERTASSSEIKAAYFGLAKTYHPDRLALVKLEAMRPQVERIFARLSDAYAALSDDSRRSEYMQVLAQGGEQAVKRRTDDEVERATRVLTAEEHFRKGEMALRREMYNLAEKEFQAALDLNDAEPEHHALLAWARWCGAADKDAVFAEVRKGLNRALELSSQNCVPAFLYFGEVYTARGDHERAYAMFQRVLGIEAHHVEAQRQVRLIEMRRGKGGEKKGLFDRFRKKP